jgi:hypothetical protein
MSDLVLLEDLASKRLGTRVCLETAASAPGDRRRRALARVLERIGLPGPVDALAFPHARVSSSRAEGLAVACGTVRSVQGVGVDYEADRRLPRGTARLMLSAAETSRLGRDVHDPAHLLRLWTLKEALFKADAWNADHWIGGYTVDDARAWTVMGTSPAGHRFRCASFRFADGVLSMAVGVGT